MAIQREKLPEVDSIVDRIVRHKQGYQPVERPTRVPWFAIGAIHSLEAGDDFNCHLHNGDPLTAYPSSGQFTCRRETLLPAMRRIH
jgi:lysozyme family protein